MALVIESNFVDKNGNGLVYFGTYGGVKVAVKKVLPTDVLVNGKQEKTLMELRHPNVVHLLHVEVQGDFRLVSKQTLIAINVCICLYIHEHIIDAF
jgi:hypothetical protein